MKSTILIISLLAPLSLFGQQVIRMENKCHANYNNIKHLGGKLVVKKYSNDTTYLEFSTYGHCNDSLQLKINNLNTENTVILEITNKNMTASGSKCYCMYELNPVIIGITDPKSKSWVIRNKTIERSEWEKWFWDHL